ncbi:MAG: peptidylprolyl isomerase [candidate division WOR-3 bacterium]
MKICYKSRKSIRQLEFGVIAFTYLLISSVWATTIAERIVAVVGEEIILQSELKAAVEFLQAMGANLPDSILRREALSRMIQEKLILLETERETIQVSRAEIENELEKVWENIRSRFPSEEAFQKALEKEGLTEREVKNRYGEEIRKKILGQKLLQKKGLLQIFVSPLEVKKFYEDNKDSLAKRPGIVSLAHIFRLITPGEENEKKAQKKILEIYNILLRGGDFEEVAKSFSEDEKTKKSGGDLGWLKKGALVPEIEEHLFNLKEGEVSQPFRSPLGYQILRCEKKSGEKIAARHILVKVIPTREDTLREKNFLFRLRQRILAGESFDSLAKEYSQDFQTKDKGGYLGETYIALLPLPFQEMVNKLKEEEISEPIFWVNETEEGAIGGFHLFKVLKKEEERIIPFEELQDVIRNYLWEKKISEKSEEYLKKVAERTYIKEY